MLNKPKLANLANEIWKGAIKLRGKFKAKDYPAVILPMIMIRRIECVLIEERTKFLAELKAASPNLDEDTLKRRAKIQESANLSSWNKSIWTLSSILAESSTQVEANFRQYLNGFSYNIQVIIGKFDYRNTVTKMVKEKRLTNLSRLVYGKQIMLEGN